MEQTLVLAKRSSGPQLSRGDLHPAFVSIIIRHNGLKFGKKIRIFKIIFTMCILALNNKTSVILIIRQWYYSGAQNGENGAILHKCECDLGPKCLLH